MKKPYRHTVTIPSKGLKMLTELAIRKAKPTDKIFKLHDRGGLYLSVNPSGSKIWRFDYRYNNKRKTLTLGHYPGVGLVEARETLRAAKKELQAGIDPSTAKQTRKLTNQAETVNQFEAIAREWHSNHMTDKSETHAAKILRFLEKDVFPWLGKRPISEIEAPEILITLRRIESRGASEITQKTKRAIGQVFRYAIATGRATRNPVPDLQGALKPQQVTHYAAITDPAEIAGLLRAADSYTGSFVTRCALQLSFLVMLRPGEVRRAEWSEINLERKEWRIPASKMKMKAEHIVPLSRQAIAIFEEIRPLTSNSIYVFPSVRSNARPMSENTITGALRRMGYTGQEMTAHGFRAMASTRLNEAHLFHPDAIERQLAHGEQNQVRAAYHRAEYLPERVKMMQWWADYLDGLKAGAKVIPFQKEA